MFNDRAKNKTKTSGTLRGRLIGGAAAVAFLSFSGAAHAVPTGPETFTEIGVTWEKSIQQILAETGYELNRISDTADALWEIASKDAEVRARARHAGYENDFGVMSWDNGQAGESQSLFTVRGPTDWESADEEWVNLGNLFELGDTFLLAIQSPHRTFTSADTINADGLDHMVTWVDAADNNHYFVGFEDTLGGGDSDFNDLVIELRLVIDGPIQGASIPEPSSIALLGAGLVGLGWIRRRRKAT